LIKIYGLDGVGGTDLNLFHMQGSFSQILQIQTTIQTEQIEDVEDDSDDVDDLLDMMD